MSTEKKDSLLTESDAEQEAVPEELVIVIR